MTNVRQARDLLESLRFLAAFLDEEEMHEIGLVLIKAAERIEKEQESES